MITILNEDVNSYSYTGPGFADDAKTIYFWNNDDDDPGYFDDSINFVWDGLTLYVERINDLDDSKTEYHTFKLREYDKAIEELNRLLDKVGSDEVFTKDDLQQYLSRYDFDSVEEWLDWYAKK